MIKTILVFAMVTAVIAAASPAQAFTLINQDGMAHHFTILVKDDEWRITVGPNETLVHMCPVGCSISLAHHKEQDFRGDETVSIKDGRLTVADQSARDVCVSNQPEAPAH